jgi:hypothetical protein
MRAYYKSLSKQYLNKLTQICPSVAYKVFKEFQKINQNKKTKTKSESESRMRKSSNYWCWKSLFLKKINF